MYYTRKSREKGISMLIILFLLIPICTSFRIQLLMQKHCKSFKLTLLFKKHVSNSSCVSKWASKYFPMCQSSQSLGKRAFQTEYKKEHSQRVVGYDYSFYSALLRMYLTDCLEPAIARNTDKAKQVQLRASKMLSDICGEAEEIQHL